MCQFQMRSIFILIILFNLSKSLQICDENQMLCRGRSLHSEQVTWCCQTTENCGENYGRCESKFTTELSRYLLIILSSFLITVFIIRCLFLCLSCRNLSNDNHSITDDQIIRINDHWINMIDEESPPPPSYEQVMNENNHYRFTQD